MIKAMKKAPKGHKGSVSKICERFGLKRDSYYKFQRRNKKSTERTNKVISLVKERRKDQSREGVRKLHEALIEDFILYGLKVGRDKLFDILRENHMLVYKKRAGARTTNSYHHFHKYKNLIKNMKITKPNQVWVSDITYIRLVKGFCYLALITDAYSRKIVGYEVSDTLELAGCLGAFKRAQKAARPAVGLVHHSDRGSQYCSNEYVALLKKHGVRISMTEENHCYENAMAERVNGILKDEFYLDQCFFNIELAKKACINAINIYNTKRLHLSLNYKTPEQVFKMRA
jgi:transposase InsO family protein